MRGRRGAADTGYRLIKTGMRALACGAAFALAVVTPAIAAKRPPVERKPAAATAVPPKSIPLAVTGKDALADASAEALRVSDWIAASSDNRSLPYAIIDKQAASLFLFDAGGQLISRVPVLIGVAQGDDASPGIGSKKLAEIGPAEKTTPAGRFLARYGLAVGGTRVLWVDYATSVALHPIPPDASKSDHRRERMLSATPDDNRITFGCINVPLIFYKRSVEPLFGKKGGYVYIMPDTRPLESVFPQLIAQPNGGEAARSSGNDDMANR